MANKAIIWGRVSTIYQEIDAQVNELIDMALRDGYDRQNLIIIKSKGASAIKENELYRREVERLISTIDGDSDVNCVYVWEVSRLARVELTFYKLKDYITKNKIQLIVKTPAIRLLNADGDVDASQEIVLNIMVTLAKQEMQLKKKRMMRGAREAQSRGKWSGGKNMLFGYTTDRDGYIIVNEEHAAVVRQVFDMYLNENMSAGAIFRYFADRGVWPHSDNKSVTTGKITAILKNRSYCGGTNTYMRNGKTIKTCNKYPAIVDAATVDDAIAKIGERMRSEKTTSKNIYYAKGLLHCECGYVMAAKRNTVQYRCERGHSVAVSINAVDTALWIEACALNDWYLYHEATKSLQDNKREIEDIGAQINGKTREIEVITEKIERLSDLYIDGKITREKYNEKSETYNRQISDIRLDITKLQNRTTELQRIIDDSDVVTEQAEKFGTPQPVTCEIEDDATRKKIINKVIARCDLKRLGKRHYKLTITNAISRQQYNNEWWEIKTVGNQLHLYEHFGKVTIDHTHEILRRFSQL